MKHIFHIYHPLVILFYLMLALVCTMLTLHPVYIITSLVAGAVYAIYLSGIRSFAKRLTFLLPMCVLISIINPLFNHRGNTVLFHLFGNPITWEATVYGLLSGGLFLCIFIWFMCFNALMNNEKFMYLFKGLPNVALMLSMTMKLIDNMQHKLFCIEAARKGINSPGRKGKAGRYAGIITILLSWSMEDSIETADSMKARGYGKRRRTSYTYFRLHTHDFVSLALLVLLFALNIYYITSFANDISFYNEIRLPAHNYAAYAVFALSLMYPFLLELKEGIRWRLLA